MWRDEMFPVKERFHPSNKFISTVVYRLLYYGLLLTMSVTITDRPGAEQNNAWSVYRRS